MVGRLRLASWLILVKSGSRSSWLRVHIFISSCFGGVSAWRIPPPSLNRARIGGELSHSWATPVIEQLSVPSSPAASAPLDGRLLDILTILLVEPKSAASFDEHETLFSLPGQLRSYHESPGGFTSSRPPCFEHPEDRAKRDGMGSQAHSVHLIWIRHCVWILMADDRQFFFGKDLCEIGLMSKFAVFIWFAWAAKLIVWHVYMHVLCSHCAANLTEMLFISYILYIAFIMRIREKIHIKQLSDQSVLCEMYVNFLL